MHFLINLLIAILAGVASLAILRSLAKSVEDGWRILVAIIIGLIVFLANLAQYVTTLN